MSIQIQVAQSQQDEVDFVEFLRSLSLTLFHPRIFAEGTFEPKSFAPALGERLAVFREMDHDSIIQMVSPVVGKPAMEQVLPRDGLIIEWERTRQLSAHKCVPGRIYWPSPRVVTSLARGEIQPLMRKAVNFIKHTYPLRTEDKYPYYVGPSLGNEVALGRKMIVYRGGSELKLVDNHNCL